MKTHVVIGPPGTGKTTYVARQARRAVEQYGPDRVLICSLTRAAAAEAAGRDTGIPKEQLGTLHSLCHRALGRPKLVTTKEIAAWNREHPAMALSDDEVIRSDDNLEFRPHLGLENLLRTVNLLRARRRPVASWPERHRTFFERWTDWKRVHGVVDFPELIERAIDEVPIAPGSPSVIFGDEFQDFSALEVECLGSWGLMTHQLVLVGDPLQSIYGWRGADPEHLIRLDADSRTVLSQSYRVPRAVHARATRMTRGLPGSDAEYQPTREPGEVDRRSFELADPRRILRDLAPRLAAGDTVMLLTSCGYMLQPLIQALRRDGVPYHNPFATNRWSPLASATDKTATWQRIAAFLRPLDDSTDFLPRWTATEVRQWAPMLRADVMTRRGAKKDLTELDESTPADAVSRLLLDCFQQQALDALFTLDLDWILEHATAQYQRAARYPCRVLANVGRRRFLADLDLPPRQRPWVILGTIHSVKGGEADHVYLFPDLSEAGYKQRRVAGSEGYPAIRRMFYVGVTRARRRLVLCQPSGPYAVRL